MNKNRTSFVLLLLLFIIPVVLAKLALENDWFNRASTNKGLLLDPIVQADSLLQDAERKWHFLYVLPEDCSAECENAIYSAQQVYTAVGREKNRVNALFLATQESSPELIRQLQDKDGIEILTLDSERVEEVFAGLQLNAIYITDTMHNLVLYYPNTSDREQAIMDSRDMLSDIRKLLKLSRIG